MVRAMNNSEAKAKWGRIIAKRNAELERKMKDDPERARDEALESVATLRRRLGLPPLIFERADERRKRLAALNERLGILPPIEDKKGIASNEVTQLSHELETYIEKLKARIVEPVADPNGDAYWESDWALYSTEELFAGLISTAARLGTLLIDTPTRQALDRRHSASLRGKKSGEIRRIEADETWRPHALKLAKEGRKNQPAITQGDLAYEIKQRWKLIGIRCPKTQLVLAIRQWERSGEIPKRHR
jgi:hypothetical protein